MCVGACCSSFSWYLLMCIWSRAVGAAFVKAQTRLWPDRLCVSKGLLVLRYCLLYCWLRFVVLTTHTCMCVTVLLVVRPHLGASPLCNLQWCPCLSMCSPLLVANLIFSSSCARHGWYRYLSLFCLSLVLLSEKCLLANTIIIMRTKYSSVPLRFN
jgi:hypothetical protein